MLALPTLASLMAATTISQALAATIFTTGSQDDGGSYARCVTRCDLEGWNDSKGCHGDAKGNIGTCQDAFKAANSTQDAGVDVCARTRPGLSAAEN